MRVLTHFAERQAGLADVQRLHEHFDTDDRRAAVIRVAGGGPGGRPLRAEAVAQA